MSRRERISKVERAGVEREENELLDFWKAENEKELCERYDEADSV